MVDVSAIKINTGAMAFSIWRTGELFTEDGRGRTC